MKTYRIAFIPGDGVGPEVALEARLALEACARKFSFAVEGETFGWNCDYYLAHGRMMPEDGLEVLRSFDAVFLGSVGDPAKVPDHISLGPLLAIRQGFCQYVNLRPIRMLEGVRPSTSSSCARTPRANTATSAGYSLLTNPTASPRRWPCSPAKAVSA